MTTVIRKSLKLQGLTILAGLKRASETRQGSNRLVQGEPAFMFYPQTPSHDLPPVVVDLQPRSGRIQSFGPERSAARAGRPLGWRGFSWGRISERLARRAVAARWSLAAGDPWCPVSASCPARFRKPADGAAQGRTKRISRLSQPAGWALHGQQPGLASRMSMPRTPPVCETYLDSIRETGAC